MDVTGARTVASCDQESLKIYSDSGENLDLTREEFNKLNGNMARHFLVNFDEYVPGTQKLRVLSLVPTTYKLKVGTPEERAIPAYHLNGKFRLAQYPEYEIDFLITFGKGLPAVAQILRLRVLEQSWFRLLDSKRESL